MLGDPGGAHVRLRAHEVLTLRPAVPADAAAQRALCEAMAPPDFRLFGAGPPVPGGLAGEPGALDGVGLVALRGEGGDAGLVGLARLALDPDGVAGEFALLVHPAAQRRGLGRLMMERLLGESRRRGLRLVRGAALPRNTAMLALARAAGFQLLPAADGTVELMLALGADGRG
jgi:acetyltransferase